MSGTPPAPPNPPSNHYPEWAAILIAPADQNAAIAAFLFMARADVLNQNQLNRSTENLASASRNPSESFTPTRHAIPLAAALRAASREASKPKSAG
jgi:hypothetical protein